MKRITCDFSLLDFGTGTFLASHSFLSGLLSVTARFFGVKAGAGKNIQSINIPEATFLFRDVSFCERTVRALDKKTGLFGEPTREKENITETGWENNPDFCFSGDSKKPAANVKWTVRARAFEMELGDDILGQLSEAGLVFHFC